MSQLQYVFKSKIFDKKSDYVIIIKFRNITKVALGLKCGLTNSTRF